MQRLKHSEWLNFYYKRGDKNARSFASYEEWLKSLDDEDLLDNYLEIRDAQNNLD